MCFALDSLELDPLTQKKPLRAIKCHSNDILDDSGEASLLGTLLRHTAPLSLDLVIVYDKHNFSGYCREDQEGGHCAGCPLCRSHTRKLKVLGKMLKELREKNNVVNVRPVFCAEVWPCDIRRHCGPQRTVDFITKMLKFYMQELQRGESGPGLELPYDLPIISSMDGVWRGL